MEQNRFGILVAGGSGGIGHEVVGMLKAKGYRVAVLDRVEPRHNVDLYVACDLANLSGVHSAVESAWHGLGPIDALVMCAARYDAATLDDSSLESFTAVLHVNLVSAMALVKAWLALGSLDTPGVIILVGSAAGHIGSRDPAYSASKAGLLGLCRSLALNLTDRGFCVYSVSPGVVRTSMSNSQPAERREAHVSRTLLKRAAEPAEVATLIVWLVETRPQYMSGSDFNVSNGLVW